jgi:hypothetical protein
LGTWISILPLKSAVPYCKLRYSWRCWEIVSSKSRKQPDYSRQTSEEFAGEIRRFYPGKFLNRNGTKVEVFAAQLGNSILNLTFCILLWACLLAVLGNQTRTHENRGYRTSCSRYRTRSTEVFVTQNYRFLRCVKAGRLDLAKGADYAKFRPPGLPKTAVTHVQVGFFCKKHSIPGLERNIAMSFLHILTVWKDVKLVLNPTVFPVLGRGVGTQVAASSSTISNNGFDCLGSFSIQYTKGIYIICWNCMKIYRSHDLFSSYKRFRNQKRSHNIKETDCKEIILQIAFEWRYFERFFYVHIVSLLRCWIRIRIADIYINVYLGFWRISQFRSLEVCTLSQGREAWIIPAFCEKVITIFGKFNNRIII